MAEFYTKGEADGRFLHADPDGANTKRNLVPLLANEESKAVVFGTAFAAKPRTVKVSIRIPSGGEIIVAVVDDALTTQAGFTVRFQAPIPGAGYSLDWIAIL